jgi:hypothetical protein
LLFSLAATDAYATATLVSRDAAGTLTTDLGAGLFALHAALAVINAAAVVWATQSRTSGRALGALAFVLALFIPGLGALGLGLALVASQGSGRNRRERAWQRLDTSEALDAPPRLAAHRNLIAGDLIDALADRTPENAAHRFQVVLSTRHLRARSAIAVLKVALKDPSDDVRLFAFSRIEQFRATIEDRIESLKAATPEDDDEQTVIDLRLAESHWELAYLGLVEGAVLQHTLATAKAHVEDAARRAPSDAPVNFVRGRILLALGDVVAASAAFTKAMNHGYPRRRVLPYLAECAYRRRELDVVPRLMREVASSPQDHPYLAHVTDFWT